VEGRSSEGAGGSGAAVKEEAATGGEAAAFGFIGRRNVTVEILGATGKSWIDGIEMARVEGRIEGRRGNGN
jgi:hypothetical protein